MDEGSIVRLEFPTEAAVAALCAEGWSVMLVEPNVALVSVGPRRAHHGLLRGRALRMQDEPLSSLRPAQE
jgi:hypothetical protein